jgi:hypothetical protein
LKKQRNMDLTIKNLRIMNLKKRLLHLTFLFTLLALTACGGNKQDGSKNSDISTDQGHISEHAQGNTTTDMHRQHNNLAENFVHMDIVILHEPYRPPVATKTEMEQVINAYLQIKDALFKGDEGATDKAVGLMDEKVASVVSTQLEAKGLEAWQNHQALYKDKLKEMQHVKGLENKRSYFGHISEIMYCTIKSFGLRQGPLFAIFCPMAFDNKGAYWISDSKTVQNPYFGSKMPTCGETKEEL